MDAGAEQSLTARTFPPKLLVGRRFVSSQLRQTSNDGGLRFCSLQAEVFKQAQISTARHAAISATLVSVVLSIASRICCRNHAQPRSLSIWSGQTIATGGKESASGTGLT